MVAQRRELAARYHELLAAARACARCATRPTGTTNYQSFWVLLAGFAPAADEVLADAGRGRGVGAGAASWPRTWSRPTRATRTAELPVTERLTRDSLILPLHHALTEDDQDRVVDAFASAVRVPSGVTA